VVVVPTAIVAAVPGVPARTQVAGVDQVKLALDRELTIAIEAQTMFVGFAGGMVDHPVGSVPTLVVKSHDPPVGVAGAVAASLKINHSKYVPPKTVVLPYRPTVSPLVPKRPLVAILIPT
jgi:hypothetical protein